MSDSPLEPKQPTEPSNTPKTDVLKFGPDDAQLQKELQDYARAIRQEFAETNQLSGLGDGPESNVEKYTRSFFKNNLADAVAQIVWLACNATSDSVRLRASQIIVKEALEDCRTDGDPIKELFAMLKVNDDKVQPDHAPSNNTTTGATGATS